MSFDQLCVFSISCGYMLFDQLYDFFDQLWLHVIRSVVCLFSISRGYMLFDQLCDVFRSVVVTCYSISCASFFDQSVGWKTRNVGIRNRNRSRSRNSRNSRNPRNDHKNKNK